MCVGAAARSHRSCRPPSNDVHRGELTWRGVFSLAIDPQRSVVRPRRDAQLHRKTPSRLAHGKRRVRDSLSERRPRRPLFQPSPSASLYLHTYRTPAPGPDSRPLTVVILFLRTGAVIRIIRIVAVARWQARRQYRVVSVRSSPSPYSGRPVNGPGIAPVSSRHSCRRRLEWLSNSSDSRRACPAPVNELLLWRPTSGRVALRLQEAPGVRHAFSISCHRD